MLYRFEPDDAYISFRYVTTWLAHGEIAWNPGERVEGYSHPLYLLLLAGGGWSGLSLRLTAKLIGIACGIGAVLHSISFARRHLRLSYPALPAVAVATSLCFAIWEVGCLETMLFAWLGIMACDAACSSSSLRPLLLGASLLALALTRPEGPLLAVGVCIWSLTQREVRRAGTFGWIPVFAIGFGAFLLWRHHYYGDWLPNTYYVKTSGGTERWVNGLSYSVRFALTQSPLVVLVLAGWFTARHAARAQHRPKVLLAIQLSLYALFVIWAGGDWMPGFRFWIGVLPLLALLAAALTEPFTAQIASRARRPYAWVVALVLALLVRGALEFGSDPSFGRNLLVGFTDTNSAEYRVALFLNRVAAPGMLVATTEAGIIPYETPSLRYIDLIGLNDRHLARRSTRLLHEDDGDPDYFFERRPEFLVSWGFRGGSGEIEPAVRSVAILMNDRRFADYVKVAEFPYSDGSGLFVYRRRH